MKNEKRAVFLREKLSENRPEIAFHQSDSAHKVEIGVSFFNISDFVRQNQLHLFTIHYYLLLQKMVGQNGLALLRQSQVGCNSPLDCC